MRPVIETLREVWPCWVLTTVLAVVSWWPLGREILVGLLLAGFILGSWVYTLEFWQAMRDVEKFLRFRSRLMEPDVLPPVEHVAYTPRPRGEG